MSFSERYGYKPLKETIQVESMDEPLRNGLWSLLKVFCWDKVYCHKVITGYGDGGCFLNDVQNREIDTLCKKLWFDFFKKPFDTLDNNWNKVLEQLRQYYFSCKWNEVYDFIEFIGRNYPWSQSKKNFIQSGNNILEKEMSAYRFVDNVIARITENHEVEEVQQAIKTPDEPVRTHMHRALELLSDRDTPDYRNSIKESISAVESLLANILSADNGTLGELLKMKKLDDKIKLHPALKEAFSKLYGYTSDKGGIRHALTEKDNIDFHDAKFMLVICSAFINFVNGKLKNNQA